MAASTSNKHECGCARLKMDAEETKIAIAMVKRQCFNTKLELKALVETDIRHAYAYQQQQNTNQDQSCYDEMSNLVDLKLELFIETCNLEAYKKRIEEKDPAAIAKKRMAALQKYKEKYNLVHQNTTVCEHTEPEDGFDEVD